MLRLGMVVYWTLNAGLLLAEARWHILTRLTLWDISQIHSMIPGLAHLKP